MNLLVNNMKMTVSTMSFLGHKSNEASLLTELKAT